MDYFNKLQRAEPIIGDLPEPTEVAEPKRERKRPQLEKEETLIRELTGGSPRPIGADLLARDAFWEIIDRIGWKDGVGGFMTDEEALAIVEDLPAKEREHFKQTYRYAADLLMIRLNSSFEQRQIPAADRMRIISHVIATGRSEVDGLLNGSSRVIKAREHYALDCRLPADMHIT